MDHLDRRRAVALSQLRPSFSPVTSVWFNVIVVLAGARHRYVQTHEPVSRPEDHGGD